MATMTMYPDDERLPPGERAAFNLYLISSVLLFVLMMLIGLVMRTAQGEWMSVPPNVFYQLLSMHGAGMVGTMGLVPALPRVRDLRVELHRVEAPLLVGHAGDRAAVGRGHQLEAGRQAGDLVAMAHPDREHAVALGRAAELLRHGLHAVADAEHRHAELEHRLRRAVGRFLVHAGMAAGQDHATQSAVGRVVAHPGVGHVAGVHFAVHMGFADAPRDQLRDLGAEVEDQDFVVLHEISASVMRLPKRWVGETS